MPNFVCPICGHNLTSRAEYLLSRSDGQLYTLSLSCPSCHEVSKYKLVWEIALTGAEPILKEGKDV